MRPPCRPSRGRPVAGFSLLELVITVAVLGIVASLAYPSFMGSVRKGRRAEAFTALSAVQQAQERWRANSAAYATDTEMTTAPPGGLGLPSTTAGGLYTIAVANASATGYDVVATPVSGKSQVKDGDCAKLGLRLAGGNISYGGTSAAGSLSYAATSACWSR